MGKINKFSNIYNKDGALITTSDKLIATKTCFLQRYRMKYGGNLTNNPFLLKLLNNHSELKKLNHYKTNKHK